MAIVVFGIAWYGFVHTPLKKTRVLYVYRGDSLKAVAKRMASDKILPHPLWFDWLGRALGVSHCLKVGEYQITPSLTPKQLLDHMLKGQIISHHLTLISGWTFQKIRQILLHNPYLNHQTATLSSTQIMLLLGNKKQKPEGLFFPDTYQFHWRDSDLSILKRAYHKMQQVLSIQWAKRARHLPYKTPYAALIMASLIEKETALKTERLKIAGVLVRRLQKHMHLDVDPSLVYGLHEPYGYRLNQHDLKQYTPYNTYLIYGLPPTPIDTPSLASLWAALHPCMGRFLYYVSRNNGTHQFSSTYAEQKCAVKRWQ